MLKNKLSKETKVFISLLNELSTREKKILIERFIKNKSMKNVAIKLNITRSRVKQIEDKITKHISNVFKYVNL